MSKNILLLAICQAMMLAATSLTMTSSALVGLQIAPLQSLATLPLAITYVTVMLMLIPSSLFMHRFGRRLGFSIGALGAIVAGVLAGFAIYNNQFVLFCIAAVFQGVAMSSAQFYRFAAAEVATDEYKSRAISWVLAGGLLAAFIGPNVARFTKNTFVGPDFSATFSSVAIMGIVVLICLFFLRIPQQSGQAIDQGKRPILTIMLQPVFIVAVICAMIAYGSMNLLMTSTPLAMDRFGMNFDLTATVIQWHIVGMFAPSFFTGSLIHRFGVLKIMFIGALMLFACISIGLSGQSYPHFLGALVALGIGWNFLYIGGTTLLTQAHSSSEKGAIQGINDFLVFTAVSITALGSGYLHHLLGWQKLNLTTLPAIFIALFCILLLGLYQSRNRCLGTNRA